MYNSEKYILSAIESILNQQEHGLNYEIVVVDDGSIDNSLKLVSEFNNEKIKIVALEKNGGLSNARNEGMKIAQGEWLQFLDSDDTVCIDLYQKFEKSKKPDFNCYVFSLIHEYNNKILKQTIIEIKDERSFAFFGVVCNKFIKKQICEEFEKGYLFEDNIFNVKMLNKGNLKIGLINDAYYLYNRKKENSITANFKKKEFEKMYNYIYNQIDKSTDLTKRFILELFVAIIFDKEKPFFWKVKIAIRTFLKLNNYLPKLIKNQFRICVKNETILT